MGDLRGFAVVDLSLTLDEGYPLTWPGLPTVQRRVLNWYARVPGPNGQTLVPSIGTFYAQSLCLDEHTGTHVDFPSHNIAPANSGYPNAGVAGDAPGHEYPLKNLYGPADVVDVRFLLDTGTAGKSPEITVAILQNWESQFGEIQKGDVVLLNSGYCDRYFSAQPAGDRMFEPVTTRHNPGWPAPTPDAIEFLFQRGVRHVGVTTPTIGAVEDLGPAHIAGLSQGMSYSEMLINLHRLPVRGAWYFMLPLKIAHQSGGPGRAVALVPESTTT